MFHDEDRVQPDLDAKTRRIEESVRRLVLMKETGPKSAAWHRARVRTIWRLQRALELRTDQDDRAASSYTDQAEIAPRDDYDG